MDQSLFFENHPEPMWIFDRETLQYLAVNNAAVREFGYGRDEFMAMTIADLRSPEDIPRLKQAVGQIVSGPSRGDVWRLRRKSGSWAQVDILWHTIDFRGRSAVLATIRDISDQMQAESQLSEAIRVLRLAGKIARFGAWRVTLDPLEIYWSDETAAIHEEPPGTSPSLGDGFNYYPPEFRPRIEEVFTRCVQDGTPFNETLQILTAKGNRPWVRVIGEPERDAHGNIVAVYGAFQDVTELMEARTQSEAVSGELRRALANMSDAFFTLDKQWRFTFINAQGERMLERRREELLGKSVWDEFPEAVGSTFQIQYEQAVATGQTSRFSEYYPPLRTWFDVSAYPGADGLAVYFRDVTEQRMMESALRERIKELRCIYHVLTLVSDPQRTVQEVVSEVVGAIPQGMMHESATVARITLNGIDVRTEPWQEPVSTLEVPVTSADGSKGRILVGYVSTMKAPRGERSPFLREESEMLQVIATHLGQMVDRRSMSEKLSQSQKMNAIGQLTGGVAHDFNNLLTVILGNTEVLAEELQNEQRLKPLADMTLTAATRGAELTSRLLSFSRRQTLEPKSVDVNRLIADMDGLVRRTLSREIDIRIKVCNDLWLADVDPGQLEVALLNLVINARDAISGNGRLTLETGNAELGDDYVGEHEDVQPGQYVMVSVSDDGSGMSPDVVARAFEPFFTTKGIGRGSGLGLSMVHGFAKQSGGHIKIYSETGEGTTVKIYFQRSRDGSEGFMDTALDTETDASQDTLVPGDEHILVVEDDFMVREHLVAQLTGLGYRVSVAETGDLALEMIRRQDDVDLLFTDVVMPGMNGRQLAEAAQKVRPGLRVLFTSGYTENAIVHQGRLDADVELLSKPYLRRNLAMKVRRILDADPADGS